ncbi:hypothetical protein [Corynebacterium comes]|uniref:Uncharacterized protein n=1 Tax=Corynebacterium comes TaxID=2675218 RepID=A0A6B8WBE8_9CORY|nr:hypothetical protein [Corynebacterium comes]QGU04178.1 hypothetical protein CETAM_04535 [Corynebacterium comes]
MRKLLVPVSLLALVSLVGVLAFFGGGAWTLKKMPTLEAPLETVTESSNEKIVTAVDRQEQLVLLSANVQGLSEERANRGNLPGTERTQFVKYTYRAKLGIEGGDVNIKETGDNRYLISVPEFIFIGHDRAKFEIAVENNGPLSWITPDIDTAKTITKILNEDAKAEQVKENRDLLEDQTENFYTGIIHGIDDQVEIEFEFR